MLNIATVESIHGGKSPHADDAAQVEILCDVLRDGCSYLEDLSGFLGVTTGQFRIGNAVQANGSLAELLTGFGLLLQTIDVVGTAMGSGFEDALPGNRSLESLAHDLNGALREILAAQERKDLVLIADLLEYELAPCLETWKGIFAGLLTDLS